MTYDRQQLLWQKQVTIIGSINLGSHINEYHAGVVRFQHAVSYSQSFSEFFSIANVNSFFIDETNEDHIIQQLFWGEGSCDLRGDLFEIVSISCPEDVSLKTSNHGRGDKMICITPDHAV